MSEVISEFSDFENQSSSRTGLPQGWLLWQTVRGGSFVEPSGSVWPNWGRCGGGSGGGIIDLLGRWRRKWWPVTIARVQNQSSRGFGSDHALNFWVSYGNNRVSAWMRSFAHVPIPPGWVLEIRPIGMSKGTVTPYGGLWDRAFSSNGGFRPFTFCRRQELELFHHPYLTHVLICMKMRGGCMLIARTVTVTSSTLGATHRVLSTKLFRFLAFFLIRPYGDLLWY